MRYKLTEGIVLTKVCGRHILVATRRAWGKCPYTKELSALRAAYWKGLSRGMTDEEIVEKLSAGTKIREDALRGRLKSFTEILKAEGYIVSEEETNE